VSDENVIRFTAQVAKVQTLTDSGLRFTLDVAETEIDAAQKLMQVKQGGGVLEVAAAAIVKEKENGRRTGKHLQGSYSKAT
jgi:hypothetical protein